jgi:hypothetical protein
MTGLLTKIHVGIDAMTAAITSLHDTVRTHHDAQLERDRQMAAKADTPPRPVEKIDPLPAEMIERLRAQPHNLAPVEKIAPPFAEKIAPPFAEKIAPPFAEKIAPSNIADQIRSERAADRAKAATAHEQDTSEDAEEFTD